MPLVTTPRTARDKVHLSAESVCLSLVRDVPWEIKQSGHIRIRNVTALSSHFMHLPICMRDGTACLYNGAGLLRCPGGGSEVLLCLVGGSCIFFIDDGSSICCASTVVLGLLVPRRRFSDVRGGFIAALRNQNQRTTTCKNSKHPSMLLRGTKNKEPPSRQTNEEPQSRHQQIQELSSMPKTRASVDAPSRHKKLFEAQQTRAPPSRHDKPKKHHSRCK